MGAWTNRLREFVYINGRDKGGCNPGYWTHLHFTSNRIMLLKEANVNVNKRKRGILDEVPVRVVVGIRD